MSGIQENDNNGNEMMELSPGTTAADLPEEPDGFANTGVGEGLDGNEEAEARTPALDDMEPSLHQCWGSPQEGPLADAISAAGDDIDFLPSHNSPDMPGASSIYIGRWDPREVDSPRSGPSNPSSVYPATSSRTSAAGALEARCLIRSNEHKAGLDMGDVVMLMREGRPYVTVQARLPYKADAWHTCLELAEEGASLDSEGLAYLEIIKQGPFVGFRSGAAGNRLVQPRRKPPHGLVFFNHNCGVWEQWDVLGEEWRLEPWSETHIVFQSRRLPQVQLSVDVVRVGYLTAPCGGSTGGPFAPTPRSLQLPVIPEEDGRVEDKNLTRMSNLLIMEWLKFVDHEKLVREGVEADVTALKEDLTELKFNAIGQIEFLRSQMNDEMESLRQQVWDRDSALSATRGWLRRVQQLAADRMGRARLRRLMMAWRYLVDDILYCKAAVLRLTHKRERDLQDQVFWCWFLHSRAAVGRASKLQFAVQRRSRALLSKALLSWQHVAAHKAWRGRAIMAVVQRRSARALAGAFSSWRLEAVQRAAGRDALHRALQGVRRAELAVALMAWRAAAQAVQRQGVQAALMRSRRATRTKAAVLAGWHDEAFLRRFLARFARNGLARRAVAAWRAALVAAQARQRTAEAVAAAGPAAWQHRALLAWHTLAARRIGIRSRLGRYVMARSRGLMARSLAAWARCTRELRVLRVVLQRHLATVRQRLAAAVLAGWRARAGRRAWQRSRLMVALARAAGRRLSVALSSWRALASARRATVRRGELVAARVRRLRMAACLGLWRALAARLQLARQKLAGLCKRLLGLPLSSAFREWRLLTRTAVAARAAAARALPPTTRDLLARVLCTWWARHCGEPRSLAPASASAAWSTAPKTTTTPSGSLPAYTRRHATSPSLPEPTSSREGAQRASAGRASAPVPVVVSSPARPPVAASVASFSPQTASTSPSRRTAAAPAATASISDDVSTPTSAPSLHSQEPQQPQYQQHQPAQQLGEVAFAGFPDPLTAQQTSTSPAGPTRGSATSSPARPPLHPTLASSVSGSPVAPSSAGVLLPPPPSRATAHDSAGGGDGLGGGGGAAAVTGYPTITNLSTPTRTTPRSYREALVTGGGGTAASPAGSGAASSPGLSSSLMVCPSSAGSRSSSAPRMRGSGSGMLPGVGGGSGGASAPFVPANTAVIGAGSSPVLVEMAPGRGGEGPLTPIGLPELLDGPVEGGSEGSLSGVASAAVSVTSLTADAADGARGHSALRGATAGPAPAAAAAAALSLSPDGSMSPSPSPLSAVPAGYGGLLLPAEDDEDSAAVLSYNLPGFRASAPCLERAIDEQEAAQSVSPVLPYPTPPVSYGRVSAAGGSGLGRWLAAAVLAGWRRAVVDRRRWVATLEGVAAAQRRQLEGWVLAGWRTAVAAARDRATAAGVLAARAVARGSRLRLREALLSWHVLARSRAAEAALLTRYWARGSAAVSARVILAWHQQAAASAATKRRVARFNSRLSAATTDRFFRAWREETGHGAARRAASAQLASSHRRDLLHSALAGWCTATTERRARAARQARAARAAQRRRLQGAFSRWRWAAEAANERDAAAARAGRAASLRAAFGGWRQMTASGAVGPVDPDAALQRAAVWHSRRVLRGCLFALVEHKDEWLQLLRGAAAWSDAKIRKAVLRCWRAEGVQARRLRLQVAKMQARSSRRLLSRSYDAWLGHVDDIRTARRTAEALGARADLQLLANMVDGWRDVVAGAKEKASRRNTLELAVRRRARGVMLSHAFAGWWAAVERSSHVRSEADRRLAGHLAALLSLALAGWADLAQRMRAARVTAAARGVAADRTLLREVLADWAGQVAAARERETAAAAFRARRRGAVLPAVLRCWAAVACDRGARRLQRSALAHLVLRRCMVLQRKAFGAWRAAVLERHAREDELRRCIKRKKLAFNQFKQWYWEAFDTDVQATIRRMFHSTDPAAHSPVPSLRAPFAPASAVGPYQQQPPYGRGSLGSRPQAHQQQQPRRGATGSYGPAYGSGYGGRASYDAPADVADTSGGYRSRSINPLAAPAHTGHPGHGQHGQHGQVPHPQQPRPSRPAGGHPPSQREPIRTLAPTFDALARGQPPAGAARPKPGAAGRPNASLRSIYPVLRHSDSGSEDVEGIEREEPGAGTAGGSRGPAAGPAGRRKEVSAFGRTVHAAKAVRATPAGGARPLGAGEGGGRRPGGGGGGGGAGSRPAAPAPVRENAIGAAPAAGAGPSGLEAVAAMNAVTAVNAVLVNVASQLTEVSRASLEIAAGVVAGGGTSAGVSPGSRPFRATTGSIGASGLPYGGGTATAAGGGLAGRGSIDGSQVSSVGTGTHRGSPPGGPRGLSGTTPAPAPPGPLSPLSPAGNSLIPYGNMYGNSAASVASGGAASSGVKLPGVVPSWRQVATNQLYEAGDDWYGDGLGPVDPMYVGIASAGAVRNVDSEGEGVGVPVGEGEGGLTDGGDGPTRHRPLASAATGSGSGAFTPAAFPGGGSARGPRGEGLVSTGVGSSLGSRSASESNCFPPHSTYQNAAFQQQEEEEEGNGEGGSLAGRPVVD